MDESQGGVIVPHVLHLSLLRGARRKAQKQNTRYVQYSLWTFRFSSKAIGAKRRAVLDRGPCYIPGTQNMCWNLLEMTVKRENSHERICLLNHAVFNLNFMKKLSLLSCRILNLSVQR